MWQTLDKLGQVKTVGATGPTGPTGPTGASGSGGGGGFVTLVPPDDSTFSWANQGGASVVATSGAGVYLIGPHSAGDNLRMRVLAVPSTPYTITMACIPNLPYINGASCGLLLRDSASGKIHTVSYLGTPFEIDVLKYTNPTTLSAAYTTLTFQINGPYLWFQITDDGTNRVSRMSLDGVNFRQLHTVGHTDFLTPDQIGFYVDADQNTVDVAMMVVSWKVT